MIGIGVAKTVNLKASKELKSSDHTPSDEGVGSLLPPALHNI